MPSSRRTPAAAQTPAGGYGIRPYGRRRMPRPTGKLRPPVTTNLCRGRCLHCARRRVSEANRAAGPALRPEIVPGTPRWRKVSREGHGPPLQPTENDPPNRNGCNHPGVRRAGCPHPAGPRGGANTRGRIWNPPLRTTANGAANRENAAANPGNRGPALQQTPVGDDARIVPRTRGGANTRGRDKSRPYEQILCLGPTGWWYLYRFVEEGRSPPVGVRAAARFAGWINPSPTSLPNTTRQTGRPQPPRRP